MSAGTSTSDAIQFVLFWTGVVLCVYQIAAVIYAAGQVKHARQFGHQVKVSVNITFGLVGVLLLLVAFFI